MTRYRRTKTGPLGVGEAKKASFERINWRAAREAR
jgi:hypothetical protein